MAWTAYGRPMFISATKKRLPTNPGLGGVYSAFRGTPGAAPGTAGGPPAAPAAPSVAPTPSANDKPPDGPALDAQYGTDAASLLFRNANSIADLQKANERERTDFSESMRRLAVQRGQALHNTNEGYNKRGLFFSGQLGKARDTLNTQYDQSASDANKSFTRDIQDRLDQIARIQKSQPLDLEGLRQAAIQRALAAKAAEQPPAASAAPGDSGGTAAPAAAAPAANPLKLPYTIEIGGNKVIHRYPNGRVVVVKKF